MKTKEIMLCVKGNKEFWVKPMTEEENNQFKVEAYNAKAHKLASEFREKYNIDIADVAAFGSVNVSEHFMLDYIPHHFYHPFDKTTHLVKSCKCYAIKNHNYKESTIHFDCLSSWNCVLSILNNPKFVLIYTKDINNAVNPIDIVEPKLKEEKEYESI
jgi:hypothetical protein